MPIQATHRITAQVNRVAKHDLSVWQGEGGALALRSAPRAPTASSGHWSILLTLLGDAYALRDAAKQAGYTWRHGYWTHTFTGSLQPNADPHGARPLQAWVEQEARGFDGGSQMSELHFIPADPA